MLRFNLNYDVSEQDSRRVLSDIERIPGVREIGNVCFRRFNFYEMPFFPSSDIYESDDFIVRVESERRPSKSTDDLVKFFNFLDHCKYFNSSVNLNFYVGEDDSDTFAHVKSIENELNAESGLRISIGLNNFQEDHHFYTSMSVGVMSRAWIDKDYLNERINEFFRAIGVQVEKFPSSPASFMYWAEDIRVVGPEFVFIGNDEFNIRNIKTIGKKVVTSILGGVAIYGMEEKEVMQYAKLYIDEFRIGILSRSNISVSFLPKDYNLVREAIESVDAGTWRLEGLPLSSLDFGSNYMELHPPLDSEEELPVQSFEIPYERGKIYSDLILHEIEGLPRTTWVFRFNVDWDRVEDADQEVGQAIQFLTNYLGQDCQFEVTYDEE